MSQRIIIDVDSERVEMDVHDEFDMNLVRLLVAGMVKQSLSFDQHENQVFVNVRVYNMEGD